jgi:hypothetical protein
MPNNVIPVNSIAVSRATLPNQTPTPFYVKKRGCVGNIREIENYQEPLILFIF